MMFRVVVVGAKNPIREENGVEFLTVSGCKMAAFSSKVKQSLVIKNVRNQLGQAIEHGVAWFEARFK
jgi:hypothetical protein